MRPGYSIVTFAYNEESSIGETIRSILSNCDERMTRLTIVANGCTDRTIEVANDSIKAAQIPCMVVELSLGDKCNAWNQYIYHHLPEADVHFFVDSDVTFTEKAFPKLYEQLIKSPEKNAVTGLPQTGRNIRKYLELATHYSCLFGNLYGLSNEFVQRLLEQNIRLPIGLKWIDSQITKLVNENLEFKKDDYSGRVTFLDGVGFCFKSLSPWRLHDIKLYANRICRYKIGQLQEKYLDDLPFVEWPETMFEINHSILKNDIKARNLGKMIILRSKIKTQINSSIKTISNI